MEYADEPRLIFEPLSEQDYCDFYDLEMQSFTDDIDFYLKFIQPHHNVLELGCGSGRLTRALSEYCNSITGVDVSEEMIRRAHEQQQEHPELSHINYLLADMTQLRLETSFDVIIIPYNTLNLLDDTTHIEACLKNCRKHLTTDTNPDKCGKLLLHLYHPDTKMVEAADEKYFQFTILERNDGGKVIKETIKGYNKEKATVTLVERYRVRPFTGNEGCREGNRELKHTIHLCTPNLEKWNQLLLDSGIPVQEYWGSFSLSPFSYKSGSTLLIHAAPVPWDEHYKINILY